MKLKNKKAGGKYLSIWWIFIIVIVSVGIIIGTIMFFGSDIDLREAEADILNFRIINCLVDKGEINQSFVEGKFDIFEKCNLNKEILDSKDYFIKISLSKPGFNNVSYGENFEKSCNIQSVTNAEYFPRCIENEFNVEYNNEEIKLRVITGSNYYKL